MHSRYITRYLGISQIFEISTDISRFGFLRISIYISAAYVWPCASLPRRPCRRPPSVHKHGACALTGQICVNWSISGRSPAGLAHQIARGLRRTPTRTLRVQSPAPPWPGMLPRPQSESEPCRKRGLGRRRHHHHKPQHCHPHHPHHPHCDLHPLSGSLIRPGVTPHRDHRDPGH